MGKLAVYKYVAMMFLVAQIIVTIFTLLGLFGGNAHPAGNIAQAMLVYVLPLLIIINVMLLIYWLVRRRWISCERIPIATACTRCARIGVWIN